MRIRLFSLLVLTLALTTLSARAYRLQFKDPAGAERNYKSTLHLKGTAEVLGMSLPTESTITMTSVEKVLDKIADGSAALTFTVKEGKVQATVSVPGAEEDETIAQDLPPFAMKYSRLPNGKVTAVHMTGNAGDTLMNQLSFLNGEAEYPGQGIVFPARDLKVGDSWEGMQTFQLAAGAAMEYKVKYTITGTRVVGGKTCLIFSNDINAKSTGLEINAAIIPGTPATALTVNVILSGKETTLFDPDAGEIAGNASTMHVNLVMASAGADGLTVTMKMSLDDQTLRQ